MTLQQFKEDLPTRIEEAKKQARKERDFFGTAYYQGVVETFRFVLLKLNNLEDEKPQSKPGGFQPGDLVKHRASGELGVFQYFHAMDHNWSFVSWNTTSMNQVPTNALVVVRGWNV